MPITDAETFFEAENLPASFNTHPVFGEFGRLYYPLVFGPDRLNVSFISPDGVAVLATKGNNDCDYYGFPMQVRASQNSCEGSVAAAIAFLDSRTTSVADYSNGQSELSAACKDISLRPTPAENAWCDLTGGEEEIHKSLRKSYRSLVNWGRKNISLSYVNAINPDRSEFTAYQDFHAKIAGRSTRSQASWDAMFDWIVSGRGELSLGRIETGELVSGTMVVDGTTISFYASGVYDRERFDKPMGHWPVYNSIIRSIDRGMKFYDLGDVPQSAETNPKAFSIGQFKRGFASDIVPYTIWRRRKLVNH